MLSEIISYAKGFEANEEVLKWINTVLKNYLKREKSVELSEVEHIIDYLISDKAPKRLRKMSYSQALSNTNKWVKTLTKKGSKIFELPRDTEIVLDFGDGFKFVKLNGQKAYQREGYLMRHCVASYYDKGDEIYSLRDSDNNPHCTISKSSQQIKGKGNGKIHPKYIDYVVRFLERLEIDVRDSEMRNLGYIVPSLKDYITNKLYRDRYLRCTERIIYRDDCILFDTLKSAIKYRGNKICLLKGNADFGSSQITDLGELTSIGGNAYFVNSQITDLGELTSIGGNADFGNSQITDLGELTSIGGNADFGNSQITDLGELTSIGGNADFVNSQITDLGELTSIGGNAYFVNSQITDLGKLTSIGGNAYFRNSQITDLGELTSIGGYADFRSSQITDLGELTSIGGYAYFVNSQITDLGKLTSIGGNAYFRNSQITDLGELTSIGGYADFRGRDDLQNLWKNIQSKLINKRS